MSGFTLPPTVKTSSLQEVDLPANSPACLHFNVENMQQEKHSLLSLSSLYYITERVLTHRTHLPPGKFNSLKLALL